jgi:hypothetical protein
MFPVQTKLIERLRGLSLNRAATASVSHSVFEPDRSIFERVPSGPFVRCADPLHGFGIDISALREHCKSRPHFLESRPIRERC